MDKSVDKISPVTEEAPATPIKGQVMPDWSEEEERRAVRKLDFSLLSILGLGLFIVAVDHGNISSALTSTILKDLNVNTNQINTGAQLFLTGIVIFELPSNLLLQRVRAHSYLSCQIVCWGLVATFQAFIQNYSSFLATRFILGVFEAGFVPGGIYLLTLWYTPEEYSSRIAIYYLGKILASALSALLAAGILTLEGHLGWGGWRWLFLLEGIMTIAVALIFVLFIPQSISKPRPLIGLNRWKYFTQREEHILAERLALRGAHYGAGKEKPSIKAVLRAFVNFRPWMHVAITMLSAAAMHGMISYTPLLIKNFGFGRIQSNALASVGYFANAAWTLGLAWIGERTNWRGPMVLIAASWSVITYGCMNLTTTLDEKWTKFVLVSLTNMGGTTVHVLNVGWLIYHTKAKTARGVYSAMMVMAANLGGLSGAQVLRHEDAPLYKNGFKNMACVIAGCWAAAAVLAVVYFIDERCERDEPEHDNVEELDLSAA